MNIDIDTKPDTTISTSQRKNSIDTTLETRLKKVLEEDIGFDHDEMNIETWEFPGCIHENITPKGYDKKCKYKNNIYII